MNVKVRLAALMLLDLSTVAVLALKAIGVLRIPWHMSLASSGAMMALMLAVLLLPGIRSSRSSSEAKKSLENPKNGQE